ncbi:MAG TPA: hypothetical protein VNK24_04615, partial [Elusimicrobiota bacterium]|nr:hypothetical protein [Elusimicrobiota bacterium]
RFERRAEVFYARRTKNDQRLPYNRSTTYRSAKPQSLPSRASFAAEPLLGDYLKDEHLFLSK